LLNTAISRARCPPFTIKSHNHRLRVYFARLRRKTHCDTKKLANLAASILLYLRKSYNQYLMSNLGFIERWDLFLA
jgi:hypothetical protein